MAVYDPQQHRPGAIYFGMEPMVTCLGYMSWALWALGYLDQALERSREALTLARERSHPFSIAGALYFSMAMNLLGREDQAAREYAEALITLSKEMGFQYWMGMGNTYKGRILTGLGQTEEGIELMRQGIPAKQAAGAEALRSYDSALLAEAYVKTGKVKDGLALLAEGIDFVGKSEERLYEAELYRLRGELIFQSQVESQESQVYVEESFLRAIDIAQQQQAKSWELRAATSLARLWQGQGKNTEAYNLLAPVYNWFTEGLDMADLKDAKALLDQLS